MKIIAVNGSPRRNHNTGTLLMKALEGASALQAETECIHLRDLNYRGCASCFACKRIGGSSECAMQDELKPVLAKLKEADAVVFGAPIYFMTVAADMGSFLERFLFPYVSYGREVPTTFPKTMPSGFIYTMNASEGHIRDIRNILNPYERFIEIILGRKPLPLFACDTYQYDDYSKYYSMFSENAKAEHRAKRFPIDCQAARNLGAKLVEAVRMRGD